MIDWSKYKIDDIQNGAINGVALKSLFFRDVKNILGVQQPNAGCKNCLTDYLTRLKSKAMKKAEKNNEYILLPKRNGIALDFGSNIFVTNENIDDHAEALIKRFKKLKGKDFKMEDLFSKWPDSAKAAKVEKTEKTTIDDQIDALSDSAEDDDPVLEM